MVVCTFSMPSQSQKHTPSGLHRKRHPATMQPSTRLFQHLMTTCMWHHAEESAPILDVICGSLWSKTAWPHLVCPWELQG